METWKKSGNKRFGSEWFRSGRTTWRENDEDTERDVSFTARIERTDTGDRTSIRYRGEVFVVVDGEEIEASLPHPAAWGEKLYEVQAAIDEAVKAGLQGSE